MNTKPMLLAVILLVAAPLTANAQAKKTKPGEGQQTDTKLDVKLEVIACPAMNEVGVAAIDSKLLKEGKLVEPRGWQPVPAVIQILFAAISKAYGSITLGCHYGFEGTPKNVYVTSLYKKMPGEVYKQCTVADDQKSFLCTKK